MVEREYLHIRPHHREPGIVGAAVVWCTRPAIGPGQVNELWVWSGAKVLLEVEIPAGAHFSVGAEGKDDTEGDWCFPGSQLFKFNKNVYVTIAIHRGISGSADPGIRLHFEVVKNVDGLGTRPA